MSDSATLWTVACQAPLSMGILQARILEQIAMPSFRTSSWPRDQAHVSSQLLHWEAGSLPSEPRGKPKNIRVSSLSLLQGIFPIQESNQGLLPCRQILYQLNYQGVFRTIYSKKPPWMFLCLLSYEFLLSSMTNSPITQRVLYRLLLSTNCFQILIFQI